MKSICHLLCKSLSVLLFAWVMISAGGCQKEVAESFRPVFYPPAPDQPRLQFLTSYLGDESFDVQKPSAFESFVLGETQVDMRTIGNPYGVGIHDGKIYVCDVGQGNIKVLDIVESKFTVFPSKKYIKRPVNIFIEPDGTKFIADSAMGAVTVWNADNKLVDYFGKDMGIKPVDLTVRGDELYLTDNNANQIVVLDKFSGKLLRKLGRGVQPGEELKDDEFSFINDLAVDSKGYVYASDKIKSMVTTFDTKGNFARSYGGMGSSPDDLVRPKGIAIDKEDRIWVVDAGPATAVKVFRKDGRLLMLFGFLGLEPGNMYLPAGIHIDYDNVDLFKKFAVKGAKLEFLVFVTNQFGPNRVSVYGFGEFPKKYSKIVYEAQRKKESNEDTGETEDPELEEKISE